MKQGTKRHILMLKLKLLGIIGKNFDKAEALRKSGLFRKYGGGGGTGILWLFLLTRT
jgi:hypothetical protein